MSTSFYSSLRGLHSISYPPEHTYFFLSLCTSLLSLHSVLSCNCLVILPEFYISCSPAILLKCLNFCVCSSGLLSKPPSHYFFASVTSLSFLLILPSSSSCKSANFLKTPNVFLFICMCISRNPLATALLQLLLFYLCFTFSPFCKSTDLLKTPYFPLYSCLHTSLLMCSCLLVCHPRKDTAGPSRGASH